jgi:hypothetical protein
MKKLLALALATILALSLAACTVNIGEEKGGGNTPSGSTSTPTGNNNSGGNNPTQKPADVDFGAIMGGGAGNYSNLSPADKQAMIDAGKAEGVNVTFEADGSVRFEDESGFVTVQDPNGNWVIGTDDGELQLLTDGSWPDNEYTKLLPKPDLEISSAVDSGANFVVMFKSATMEQLKAYTEKVKAAGFNIGAETEEQEVMGMEYYSFNAQNADGYSVIVYTAAGAPGMTVEKP